MKLLMENWRDHINYLKKNPYMEPYGLQEDKDERVITFDFDDTLSLSHFDKEQDDWVHDGPHLPMIRQYKKYKNEGYKVFIITARYIDQEEKAKNNPQQKSVEEFVEEYNLSPEGIFFTNGNLKTDTLKSLNSSLHYDDDIEEIEAAHAAGIKTVLSDPYKNVSITITEDEKPKDTNKVSKIVIYDNDGKVLILKRTGSENKWDLPGGHVHQGESLSDGCKRETKEETNLDISNVKSLDKKRNVTFYKTARPQGSIQLQPEEHTDYKWINPKEISNLDMRQHLKSAINKAFSLGEQNEPFQKIVKQGHRKMKIKLVGSGPNKYNVGGQMEKPPTSRSKSAPVGFGGSLEE